MGGPLAHDYNVLERTRQVLTHRWRRLPADMGGVRGLVP